MPISAIMKTDYELFIVFVELKVFRILEIIKFKLVNLACVSFCFA